ncbi:hypothetical protein OJJOAM_004616 [Cupriavidus sp. H18C1]
MSRTTTVASLAAELSRSPEALLEQLQKAGLTHSSADDAVTEADKSALLAYLKRIHGLSEDAARRRIVVEVRKKRVVVRGADEKPVRYMPTGEPIQAITLSTDEYRMVRRVRESRLIAALEPGSRCGLDIDQAFALLTFGYDPAVIAAQLQLHQLFRIFLRKLEARVRRCCHVTAVDVSNKAAQVRDVLSCLFAEREASIHPAFAPPRVVV